MRVSMKPSFDMQRRLLPQIRDLAVFQESGHQRQYIKSTKLGVQIAICTPTNVTCEGGLNSGI